MKMKQLTTGQTIAAAVAAGVLMIGISSGWGQNTGTDAFRDNTAPAVALASAPVVKDIEPDPMPVAEKSRYFDKIDEATGVRNRAIQLDSEDGDSELMWRHRGAEFDAYLTIPDYVAAEYANGAYIAVKWVYKDGAVKYRKYVATNGRDLKTVFVAGDDVRRFYVDSLHASAASIEVDTLTSSKIVRFDLSNLKQAAIR